MKEVDTYRFDDDVLISKENGEFLEVPISTYKRSLWLKVVDKIYRICTRKATPVTDGTHQRDDLPPMEKILGQWSLCLVSLLLQLL